MTGVLCDAKLFQTFQNSIVGNIDSAGVVAIGELFGRADINDQSLALDRCMISGVIVSPGSAGAP